MTVQKPYEETLVLDALVRESYDVDGNCNMSGCGTLPVSSIAATGILDACNDEDGIYYLSPSPSPYRGGKDESGVVKGVQFRVAEEPVGRCVVFSWKEFVEWGRPKTLREFGPLSYEPMNDE